MPKPWTLMLGGGLEDAAVGLESSPIWRQGALHPPNDLVIRLPDCSAGQPSPLSELNTFRSTCQLVGAGIQVLRREWCDLLNASIVLCSSVMSHRLRQAYRLATISGATLRWGSLRRWHATAQGHLLNVVVL